MTDLGSEYGRLLAERDRLIGLGVDPAELTTPLAPLGFVTLPLNAMRCPVCGHRLDDMDGCDSCAADRDEAIRQATEGDDDA